MKPWPLGARSGTQLAPEDLCHASSGNKTCKKGVGTAGAEHRFRPAPGKWGAGEGGDRTKGDKLPTGLCSPHAEVQRQAYVSGDLQDVVWGQPDLGLGIEEGKEIEAGWSDAWNREETRLGVSVCCHSLCGPPDLLSPFTSLPCTSSPADRRQRNMLTMLWPHRRLYFPACLAAWMGPLDWFLANGM